MKKVLILITIAVIMVIGFNPKANAQEQTETLFPSQCGKYTSLYPDSLNLYFTNFDDFFASAWTVSGQPVTERSTMQFDFSSIPGNAIIDSAFLYLYWYPSTSNIGHSTLRGSNACWLQRALSSWNSNTLTWNNQPASTATNEISLPMSTNDTENYPNINILPMVQDMIA